MTSTLAALPHDRVDWIPEVRIKIFQRTSYRRRGSVNLLTSHCFLKMEAILRTLQSNLSKDSLDTNSSKIDIQYACDHRYLPPSNDKSLKEDLEEFKFNQKLQTISAKRQQLPNLQVHSSYRCSVDLNRM
jgi:hypothetical protein